MDDGIGGLAGREQQPGEGRDLEGIAIVGMACIFPKAPNLQAFWRNIISGVDAIGDPPPSWEASRYLDSGRIKTSSGGYLGELFRFDPHEFGIMPSSLDGGEPDQFLALHVARRALIDAGYTSEDHDHRDTGIVLGHSTYLHRGQGTLIQNHIVLDQTLELLGALLPNLGDDSLREVRKVLERSLPASTADIAPGLVPNVMTGRIANRLNLNGPNYLIDAACSSSLLAVAAAIDELRARRSRMMLAGGVNASLPAEVSVIFTQLGALSGRGKVRPFEAGSDGTLLGEGLGVVALKRLEDALTDGDRIYAVVRGVGQASDGRGRGLLAPNVEGETLAIRRAYAHTGIDPSSIGLIEAHGTGIPLGDKTEIAALANVFGSKPDTPPTVALGSVKSMISHCIPAAGIAGLIKTALALHHKVLPPTLCDQVNPELGLAAPLYINTEPAPWIQPSNAVRRAGINSFGFGGINTHAIVEEAPRAALSPQQSTPWPAELCIFSARDKAALIARLEAFTVRLNGHPEWSLAEIAAALASVDEGFQHRLAIVVKHRDSLSTAIEQAVTRLRQNDKKRWSTRTGAAYSSEPLGGKLAFVFPGEGSQYPGMLADLAMVFGDVREWLDFWSGLYPESPGHRRTDIVFPPAAGLTASDRKALEARLHDMDVGSEAVFVGGQALYALLRALGVVPDVMLGHSSGESSALAASGAIPWSDRSTLAEHIRQLNAVYRTILDDGKIPTGALVTVGALPLTTVEQYMAEVDRSIVVAMHNCGNQLVLFGDRSSIDTLVHRLTTAGGICIVLPFDRGYHTAAFTEASAAFRDYYDRIGLTRPNVTLYSCATARPFSDEVAAIRELAAAQWSNKVRFQETIQQMFADGVRTFVEVGPSGNLTAFVNDILAGNEYVALPTNVRRRGGVEQVLAVVAQLYVEARPLRLARLFETRAIVSIDLSGDTPRARRGVVLDNTMPRIRLGEAAIAQLRGLVQPATTPTNKTMVASPVAEPNGEVDDSTPPRGAGLGTITPSDVMADYFGLMRSFLDHQGRVMQDWQVHAGEPSSTRVEASGTRIPTSFLDAVRECDEEHLIAECRLHVHRDAFLRDHVLSGVGSECNPDLLGLACVPLMVSLEIMAQACAMLAGRRIVHVIENVRATDWIALDNLEVTLEVHAGVLDRERGRYGAHLIGASGVAVSAEFSFDASPPRCSALSPLREHRPSVWNDGELYTCGMFHGPRFQSIRHIDGWDDDGIDAQLSSLALRGFFVAGEPAELVLNPVMLDAMGQLAAYWIAQYAGTGFNCFPSTIERIELYAPCPEDVPGVELRARQQPIEPRTNDVSAARAWDFECVNAEGQPLCRMTNLRNVFFPVPARFYEVRRDPLQGWLGRPTHLEGRDGVTLWELEMFSESFCAQSGGIFLRILAQVFLGLEERSEWQALGGNLRRRREWLLGRACIKEAVRYWVYQQSGQLLYPSDVWVLHDERGAPFVDGWWRGSLVDAPTVSLSHDKLTCLAAVAAPVCRIGVDREEIGRIQKPELVFEALTPREQALLTGLDDASLQDRLLRIWCAKEAAAKFLGIGLQGVPAAFEVQFADPNRGSAHVEHAGTTVYVDFIREDTSIIALASESQQEIQ